MKRVNSPSFDSTSIFPSCFSSIMDRVIDSPKPVPSPTGFVVKNAENICSRIFSGIPIPLSSILNLKESPSFRRSTVVSRRTAKGKKSASCLWPGPETSLSTTAIGPPMKCAAIWPRSFVTDLYRLSDTPQSNRKV